MKHTSFALLLLTAPLFAGVSAAQSQATSEEGFTLGLDALGLRTFGGITTQTSSVRANQQANPNGNVRNPSDLGGKENYDFAGRISLGYQFSDGLFTKLTYSGYNSTVLNQTAAFGNDGRLWNGVDGHEVINQNVELDVSSIDAIVGQNFKPSDKLTLSPSAGLRWGKIKIKGTESGAWYPTTNGAAGGSWADSEEDDFSGFGIVLGLDVTRELAYNFSLYASVKQSVQFGENDSKFYTQEFDRNGVVLPQSTEADYSQDQSVLSTTELALGLQYDISSAANIRAGYEAQWYGGLNNTGGNNGNFGLSGFVVSANYRF